MTVDKKAFDFAASWLAGAGYTWTGDVQRLAELVQSVAEDYVADIENGPQE